MNTQHLFLLFSVYSVSSVVQGAFALNERPLSKAVQRWVDKQIAVRNGNFVPVHGVSMANLL